MPGERLSMRKIRELLRLRWEQHLPALVHVWTAPRMQELQVRILTGGSIASMCPAC